MFAAERLAKIKSIMMQQKRISVSELSEILDVSEVTIRRDLTKLEKEGYIVKTYGGAVLKEILDVDSAPAPSQPSGQYDPNEADKELIAKLAQTFVNDGDTVFIGPGSTCFHVARQIATKRNTHIVTPNVTVAPLFMDSSSKVIITGGEYNYLTDSLDGQLAMEAIKQLHTNVGFVSVDGITIERGYTFNDMGQASIIQAAKSSCSKMILVADYSKFGKNALSSVEGLNFESIITNQKIPKEFKSFFFDQCVSVYTTVDISSLEDEVI